MNHAAGKFGWLEAPPVGLSSSSPSTPNTPSNPNSSSQASQVAEPSKADTDHPVSHQAYVSLKNESDKVIAYERAGLLFVFNFHPTNSFTDYRVGVDVPGEYVIALSSDEKRFGGFGNVDVKGSRFWTENLEWNGRKNFLQVSKGALQSVGLSWDGWLIILGRCISRVGRV